MQCSVTLHRGALQPVQALWKATVRGWGHFLYLLLNPPEIWEQDLSVQVSRSVLVFAAFQSLGHVLPVRCYMQSSSLLTCLKNTEKFGSLSKKLPS